MKQITLTATEYSVLPLDENEAELATIRDRIRDRNKGYQIETGRDLIRAKAIVPHGRFKQWLDENFSWSESTAHNYMNAAVLADECPELASLSASSVVALAARSTPETVKTEVLADIAAGNVPTHKQVKGKIDQAKARKPQPTGTSAKAAALATPPQDAAEGVASGAESDLVAALRSAGLEAARAAFEAAFPGYVFTDYDELLSEVEKEAERLVSLKAA